MSYPDFTKIDLGVPQAFNRKGDAWASPEGIDIKALYEATAVSYTHLTLPTIYSV